LCLLGESTTDRDFMNGAKATEISKQTTYNPQKKNEDTLWIEASGKKRNRDSREITRKQSKKNEHQLSKAVTTANSFECLEEVLDDQNNNIRVEEIVKPPFIFVDRVSNFSSLSQLLKEVDTDEYEIKIMNGQIKIQPKSSIAYVNIVIGLKKQGHGISYK